MASLVSIMVLLAEHNLLDELCFDLDGLLRAKTLCRKCALFDRYGTTRRLCQTVYGGRSHFSAQHFLGFRGCKPVNEYQSSSFVFCIGRDTHDIAAAEHTEFGDIELHSLGDFTLLLKARKVILPCDNDLELTAIQPRQAVSIRRCEAIIIAVGFEPIPSRHVVAGRKICVLRATA